METVEFDFGYAVVRIRSPVEEKTFYETLTSAAREFYTSLCKAERGKRQENSGIPNS